MKTVTIHSGKDIFLISFVLVLSTLVGLLLAIDIKNGIYIAGLIGALAYIFLCVTRPFAAFGVLMTLGLTVWLSSIPLFGGFSVLVGVGLVFAIIWGARLLRQKIQLSWLPESWPVLGFLAALVLSTVLNWGGPAGLTGFFTYLQLLLFTVLVVNSGNTRKRLNNLGLIFIVTSTLMALMILLDQASLLPAGLVNSVKSGVIVNGSFDSFERSGGIFGDPNFASLQLLAGLPFILEFWSAGNRRQKVGLALAGVLILAGMRYTYSMGGLIGLATILLLKTFFIGKRNLFVMTVRTALLGFVGWWLAFQVLPEYYLQRVGVNLDMFRQFINTNNARLFLQLGTTRGDTWTAAFNTFLQSPIWGHGPGNAIFLNPMNSSLHPYIRSLGAHNFFLSIANDVGIIGFLFFIALLTLALRASWPTPGEKFPVRNAVFIALVASIVQGFALDIQTQKLLWILIGISFSQKSLCAKFVLSNYK